MEKTNDICRGKKRHLKYFEKSDSTRTLGTGMIIAGIAMLLWAWFIWWSYLFYILGLVFIPMGIVFVVIGSVGRSTDEEIDGLISKLSAEADIDPERDADIIKKQLRRPPPEVISGYDYADGKMFKKVKKNNVVRAEIFKKATLIAKNDGLYVRYAAVNIPFESVECGAFEIPYGEIEDIRVSSERRTVRFLKNSFSVKDSCFEIISGRECVLSLPANASATLDFFISEVKQKRDSIAEKNN